MKRFIYKLLLLGFIAAFMSDVSIDLLAKQPATPKRVAATAEITETNPVKGTVKLTWFDGDMKNELGDYFRITQFKNVNGITTEKQVATVIQLTYTMKRIILLVSLQKGFVLMLKKV